MYRSDARLSDGLPATTEVNTSYSTGACKIVTFAHRIRCFATDERQLAASQAPAHAVHSDFTPSGAIKHLQDTIKDETELNRLLDGRVLIINVWRPLKKISKAPLAVCDWTSVDPETDLVTYRMIFHKAGRNLPRPISIRGICGITWAVRVQMSHCYSNSLIARQSTA